MYIEGLNSGVRYCDRYLAKLPISWILGFYVAT